MATSKTTKTSREATAAFEHVTAASSEALRENIDRSMTMLSEASAFGKENIEALIASATAAQKGFEALSQRTVAFQRQALENHMAAAKHLMTSKSVQEFVERQSEYTRSSFDAYVAEMTSLSDIISGVTKEAVAPINERMSVMSNLIQTGAAAR